MYPSLTRNKFTPDIYQAYMVYMVSSGCLYRMEFGRIKQIYNYIIEEFTFSELKD